MSVVTLFQPTDGNTMANMNAKLTQINDEFAKKVDSATLGNTPVPKNGNTLQFPPYPTIPQSLPAAGGWAQSANYPTHAVGVNDFGLRGNFISNAAPSGGSEGDTWDQI